MSLQTNVKKRRRQSNLRNSRDEMNLCDVPFAALSERTTAKVVTFNVEEHDNELGQDVRRTYTIAGHVEHGLPTAKDEDIYLGLLKQTFDFNRFKQPLVHFSRSELFEILGWRKKDWAYARLELGLSRLAGVRISCQNAWRDNRNKEWSDRANFGILDSFALRDMRQSDCLLPFEEYSSRFTWGSVLFESFDAGYLKKLDLEIVRQLRGVVARRLYRFLDKRFFPPKKMTLRLPTRLLAYEHIGVSRRTPMDKVIKRYLQPAAEELEHVGFLDPATPKQRFVRQRDEWWVVFKLRTGSASVNTPNESDRARLAAGLVKRGVSRTAAERYVARYAKRTIVKAMQAYDEQTSGVIRIERPDRWFGAALQREFAPNGNAGPVRQSNRPERRIFVPEWPRSTST